MQAARSDDVDGAASTCGIPNADCRWPMPGAQIASPWPHWLSAIRDQAIRSALSGSQLVGVADTLTRQDCSRAERDLALPSDSDTRWCTESLATSLGPVATSLRAVTGSHANDASLASKALPSGCLNGDVGLAVCPLAQGSAAVTAYLSRPPDARGMVKVITAHHAMRDYDWHG